MLPTDVMQQVSVIVGVMLGAMVLKSFVIRSVIALFRSSSWSGRS